MSRLFEDTHPDAERVLLDGLRRMSPAQRLGRVFELRDAALSLATARMSEQGMSRREIQLRLASTWLPADVMKRVFGWGPDTP
ncbi:MAG TPA: hypothetical protein VM509_04160 [Planctomycetota bacterium]|nr:hypothetical protein [Planctomycetota bacterium]